jgi:hypothetical protein
MREAAGVQIRGEGGKRDARQFMQAKQEALSTENLPGVASGLQNSLVRERALAIC